MTRIFFWAYLLLLSGVCFAEEPQPQVDSAKKQSPASRKRGRLPSLPFLRVHDPSSVYKEQGQYWVFYTGRGVSSASSENLVDWTPGPSIFQESPDWVAEAVPGNRGHFWAPDLIRLGDRYGVYYSVSTFGKNRSAIALATSPSLNPQNSETEWTDRGIVIQTDEADDYNAIDPSVLRTSAGELWMAFGSFWSGIKLIRLDPETGLRHPECQTVHSVAWKEQIEAPTLIEKDGFFYLFVNWGWCCRGTDSTYNIRVGRSRKITGPYLDQRGQELLRGGGTLVLETEGNMIGPGHPVFIERDQKWKMLFHYYDAQHRGVPRLGIRNLTWTCDGWPEIVQPK
ncbi:MAG: arabinan endo-1,5-alpha-L-arabinosidase [Planctomycetaceae bacterium]|nr:arabinan endo-1,5-alpha-L-arabinosidase [Planctomycetaceae bacterium]